MQKYNKFKKSNQQIKLINITFFIPANNLLQLYSIFYEINDYKNIYTDSIPSQRFNNILKFVYSDSIDTNVKNMLYSIEANMLPKTINELQNKSFMAITGILAHNERIVDLINKINTVKQKYNE
jgi:hypothetical protein